MSIFSDIPNEFAVHPSKGDLVLKEDVLAIRQSLRNLINLGFMEKPFRPDITLNLRHLLFENTNSLSLAVAKRNTTEMLQALEPRAKIIDVEFVVVEDEGALIINIVYKPINTQTTEKLSVYFERVR